MIAETRKAWAGGLAALLLPALTYAATADWSAWTINDWRGVFSALVLTGIPTALAVAGVVWRIPNRPAS